jgi:hypothetical protein
MKKPTNNTQRGFAHPVLLVFLFVSVLGVVGFSGYRVMKRSKSAASRSVTTATGQIVIAKQSSNSEPVRGASLSSASAPTPTTQINIKSPGSAAEIEVPKSANNTPIPQAQTGKINVSNQYDVSTPIGSLSQLIYEAQQGDYGNALFFVTPQFVSKAYSSVGAQSFGQFINNCQSNEACKMLANTDVNFDMSHITESPCTVPSGSGFAECKKIGTKFVMEGNTLKTVYYKTVGYHVHEASVTMLRADNSTNWVINQITVDNFTL